MGNERGHLDRKIILLSIVKAHYRLGGCIVVVVKGPEIEYWVVVWRLFPVTWAVKDVLPN